MNRNIDFSTIISYIYIVFVSILIFIPFMISFWRSLWTPDGQLGLSNYFSMAGVFWPRVWLSLQLSLITVVLDLIIAIPAAYALTRYEFRGKRPILLTLIGVWYVPGIAYALSLILSFYLIYKQCLSILGFIVTYTTGFLPMMLLSSIVAFRRLEISYEEAAACLGATGLKRFIYIVLPLIGPGITSGILLTFVLSFNEFITAFLLAGPTGILTAPVKVFDDISHAGMLGFVAAEASILQIISLTVIFVYLKIVGTRYLKGTVFF